MAPPPPPPPSLLDSDYSLSLRSLLVFYPNPLDRPPAAVVAVARGPWAAEQPLRCLVPPPAMLTGSGVAFTDGCVR